MPPPSKRWPWVVGSALAAVLALAGLHAVGLLKFGAGPAKTHLQANAGVPGSVLRQGEENSPPILQAPGEAPPPILQAPSTAPPPVLEDSAKKVTMPPEDLDWLKWLEKIEKEKQQLTATEQTQLTTMIASMQGADGLTPEGVQALADPDNTSNTAPAMDDAQRVAREMIKSWAALKRKFDTYPPPPDCVPIGAAYDNGLSGMADNGQKLADLLGGIASKPEPNQGDANAAIGGVKGVGQSHIHDVDSELRKTDQLVQDICDRFDTHKWFSIDAHGGSGGMFSTPGM
ncbi:MAG: hypothetical protein ACYC96_04265 [Fimbriimonadaceae bacterium]